LLNSRRRQQRSSQIRSSDLFIDFGFKHDRPEPTIFQRKKANVFKKEIIDKLKSLM
jgi:hypothetical protein